MATDLKSTTEDVMLTRFFGGQGQGTCVQVTTTYTADPKDFFKHISLTREEAATVAADLLAFATHNEKEEWA